MAHLTASLPPYPPLGAQDAMDRIRREVLTFTTEARRRDSARSEQVHLLGKVTLALVRLRKPSRAPEVLVPAEP